MFSPYPSPVDSVYVDGHGTHWLTFSFDGPDAITNAQKLLDFATEVKHSGEMNLNKYIDPQEEFDPSKI